jgi:hypothetical protein
MSYRLQPLVWQAQLAGTVKLVLLKLCDHANDDGSSVRPSIPSVAKACGIGERTVQDAMKQLRFSAVLIQVRAADFSTRRPVEYRIDIGVLRALSRKENRCDGCTGAETAPVRVAREPVRELRSTGAAIAPKSIIKSSKEPISEKTRERRVEHFIDNEPMDPAFAKVAADLNLPDDRVSAEWAKCRDWHLSNGKGTANSKATYRNWITRAIEFAERARGTRGAEGRNSPHQNLANGIAMAMAAAGAREDTES